MKDYHLQTFVQVVGWEKEVVCDRAPVPVLAGMILRELQLDP